MKKKYEKEAEKVVSALLQEFYAIVQKQGFHCETVQIVMDCTVNGACHANVLVFGEDNAKLPVSYKFEYLSVPSVDSKEL